MGLFRWRAGKRGGRDPAAAATPAEHARLTVPSRLLRRLMEWVQRRADRGEVPRVLVAGPPSGRTIETFTNIGCRVTIEGDDLPSLPLDHPDRSFDLVLGLDVLELLDDERARAVAAEWVRVLATGGQLYLLTAPREPEPSVSRIDVTRDGALEFHATPRRVSRIARRHNREIERMLEPLKTEEIFLRRDGRREILARKAE
jgi:SAM-dependent methyltransferase